MNGIIMLFVYAAIMILATVTMTKKEKNVVNFCVGSRSENWILSALSIGRRLCLFQQKKHIRPDGLGFSGS